MSAQVRSARVPVTVSPSGEAKAVPLLARPLAPYYVIAGAAALT